MQKCKNVINNFDLKFEYLTTVKHFSDTVIIFCVLTFFGRFIYAVTEKLSGVISRICYIPVTEILFKILKRTVHISYLCF